MNPETVERTVREAVDLGPHTQNFLIYEDLSAKSSTFIS